MTHHLKSRDIIALGFMTFALFVGAGNIIFPPMVGLQAGEHVWTAAFGFLITAVGLPVLTVVALAKVGGGVDSLQQDRQPVLDDRQRLWHIDHYLCGTELWCGENGPCTQGSAYLYGNYGGGNRTVVRDPL